MASPPSNICHHERFYFSDGSLYLLVENSLYHVHKSLFEIHATKFPACGHDTSDDEIHFLEDVTKVDFDRLLACLYPRALLVAESATTEEWMSILKLASKWGFETLHEKAISEIERLASPVDMVVLGRQHDIPDILLLGYVTLCQGTTPLSFEEGHRLGVEDVINIYRIRHELYPSVVEPVSFEEVLAKVQMPLSKKEQKDVHKLEAKRPSPEMDDEQAREWADTVSVAASQTSPPGAEAFLTPDGSECRAVGSDEQPGSSKSLLDKDAETVDSARNTLVYAKRSSDMSSLASEQELSDVNIVSLLSETPPNSSSSVETTEDQLGLVSEQARSDVDAISLRPETPLDYPSYPENGPESEGLLDGYLLGGKVILNTSSNPNNVPEPSESAGQVFQFIDELTPGNFDSVTQNILQWFKTTPNSQTLYQFIRSIVERAIAEQTSTGQFNILIRLCKDMAIRLTGKVMSRDSKGKVTSGGTVFRDYLGDLCCTNLKTLAASAIVAGDGVVRIQRLRLIEFIGNFAKGKGMDSWTPDIVNNWVTGLLDGNNEEKIATLCMLMTRAGPVWDASKKKNKYQARMKNWFDRMSKVAQETSKPRVRTLLQDVIRHRSRSWATK